MVTVDANIVLPLVVETDNTEMAKQLFARDFHWVSEAFVMIELSNILATFERVGRISRQNAIAALRLGREIIDSNTVEVDHEDVLEVAMRYKITGYDARYIAVVEQLGTQLITEDKRLRKAVPRLTISLAESLESFEK